MTRPNVWNIGSGLLVVLSAAIASAQEQAAVRNTLPANTVVAVRTIDVIDSKTAGVDTEFKATVDDAVVDGDVTIVPVGAPAFLKVMQVQKAGAVRGRATVSLRLVGVEIDGRRVSFQSGDATVRSNSQGAKATKAAVGGAVIGGLLGGLLGGADGAAKGATLGAGAGVAAAAVSGQRVRVPAETRLSFTVTPAADQ